MYLYILICFLSTESSSQLADEGEESLCPCKLATVNMCVKYTQKQSDSQTMADSP